MNNTVFGRCLIGAVIAVPLIGAMFFGMSKLIEIKELQLKEEALRILLPITPQIELTTPTLKSRVPPIKSVAKPPPPPKYSAAGGRVDLPTPRIDGAVPVDSLAGKMTPMVLDIPVISDADARPIRKPVPQFPRRAMEQGISGECDVRFNVDARGKPYGIVADCTNDVFKGEAERAVAAVEFAPKIVRGKPAERRNVVYPLEFTFE